MAVSQGQAAEHRPIPQPPERFLTGNLTDIHSTESLPDLVRLSAIYGPIYQLHLLDQYIVFLSSHEQVDHVCDEGKFEKGISPPLREVRDFAGDGLFTAFGDEPNWSLAHRILVPAFGPLAIRKMQPMMMDVISQMLLHWEHHAGQPFEAAEQYTNLTFDTIAWCAFKYRFNSFHSATSHPFISTMVSLLKESSARAKRPGILKKLMFMSDAEYTRNIQALHKQCDEIIEARCKYPDPDAHDLLNNMILDRDPSTGEALSDENIRYQMVTFLIAGHETTSGLLSFATYFMLKNPAIFRKAREEADKVIGESGGDMMKMNANKLKYIDAILKETLRLCPSAPAISVTAKSPAGETLPGGYHVAKGQPLVLLFTQLHRDPKVWGDDAEEFRPERMLDGKFEALPPNAWKPFGNGKRACIGRGFAIQEALLALALIVNRFDIEMADPTYDLRLRQTLTIKPDDFKIIAKPRFRNQNLLHELLVGVRLANVTQQKEQQPQQKQVSPLPSTTGAAPSAPAEGARITFLYGSNSGSCESLAKELSSEGKARGFATTVGELDQLAGNGKLSTTEPVVICTASYEGKPCDNAKAFVDAISAMDAATAPLKGVKYIVFGAGHSDWATTFHKIPIFIDDQLAKLGAERLMPLSKADAAGDVLGDFESFKENVWKHLAAPSPSSSVSGPSASPGTALGVSVAAPDDKLGRFGATIIPSSANAASTLLGADIDKVGTVLDSVQLVPAREAREGKRHVKIRLPEGQTYRSGDYLAVLPKNPPQVIERVLRHFGVDPASQIVLSKSNRAFLPKDTPIRADNLFGSLLELAQPVSKRTLTELIELCEAEADQAKIRAMVGGYQQQVLAKRVSLLDVLVSTPGAKADLAFFLENLPKMKIRQYSISSTPLLDSETVTLSFNVVQGPSLSGHGSYYGVASTYLASLKHGDKLNCSVKPSADFHLPVDPSVPIVMFASGSGLAPFRGFIAERALMRQSGRNVGPTVLYYGSSGEEDVLHREELLQWKQSGDLDLRLVFSSLEEANAKAQQYDLVEGCKYVQHRVWAERADIVQLFDDGAQLFLCGSGQRLGAGVRKVLIDITRERKGCSESEAKETMERLSKNRYKTDVFL